MRRILLGVVAAGAAVVLAPASPAQALETCAGQFVTHLGTDGDDIIIGSDHEDVILAGAGNDRVFSGDSDDIICLGSGDDFVDGGRDSDRVWAEAGPDGNDTFVGGPGQDFVDYSLRRMPLQISLDGIANDGAVGENDNLVPNDPGDVDWAGDGIDGAVGGSAGDRMFGQPGPRQSVVANMFEGRGGDDFLIGNNAKDQFHGNDGDDTIEGFGDNDGLGGFAGNDVIRGGDGDDGIGGHEGNDTLTGGPGNDFITGAQGDDRFVADADPDGSDKLFGFTGVDVVIYSARIVGVTVKVLDTTGASEDFITADVENVVGTPFNDNIDMTTRGSDLNDNSVLGGFGDDTINLTDGKRGNDRINGGDGNDKCLADPGDVRESCP